MTYAQVIQQIIYLPDTKEV